MTVFLVNLESICPSHMDSRGRSRAIFAPVGIIVISGSGVCIGELLMVL
ncbi:hypothetical protein AZE42_12624 [Rhizopogon vesiculosus]|uniref:Uncharacterized protein n=1 Tax=Rhizopogon vesiculosus TaxID=180088 RepID=A0A1J8Q9S9_9AGAM|nr:hypothetical protein AZE42_12624 [Rhizopogon vesiculosus]